MSTQNPYIVGSIYATDTSGHSRLEMESWEHYNNGYPVRTTAVLYAWSDGIVTWTETRDDLTATE